MELDLSDNAFGPDGVRGFETLLKSPACFTLQELKLNNCGMGIGGGKVGGSPGHSLPASTQVCVFWPFRLPLGARAVVCLFRGEKQSPKDKPAASEEGVQKVRLLSNHSKFLSCLGNTEAALLHNLL